MNSVNIKRPVENIQHPAWNIEIILAYGLVIFLIMKDLFIAKYN